MGWQASNRLQHLRIFLSSPGDVAVERRMAETVIGELAYEGGLHTRVTLQAVAWDRPGAGVPMHGNQPAQQSVDIALGKSASCDIVVVIIAASLGSPMELAEYTKPDSQGYYTGTEWEFEEARRAAQTRGYPLILLYHRISLVLDTTDASVRKVLVEQLDQVDRFFQTCRTRDGAIPNAYQTPEEFRDRLRADLRREIFRILDSRAPPTEPQPRPEPRWQGCPYPGLAAFGPEHAPIYFGRARETDDLLNLLSDAQMRLIAVVGASGSGKSSLVMAGLLPALAKAEFPGSAPWVWLRFKPSDGGVDPFLAFAYAITDRFSVAPWVAQEQALADALQGDTMEFAHLVEAILQDRGCSTELLLFVDQFEELFTISERTLQQPFLDWLAAEVTRTPRARVVLTLRADFYGHAVNSPLVPLLRGRGTFPLEPPGVSALYQMIVRPAERAGLSRDSELADTILNDTGTDPGALALMAFTLEKLYERGQSRQHLSLDDYSALGRVRGAISREAEAVVGRLGTKARESLGLLFRELVTIDARGTPTRKQVPRGVLDSVSEVRQLTDALIQARILVTWTDKRSQPVVELAHEVLLESWPTLVRWLNQYRNDLLLRQKLASDASEWAEKQRPEGSVWSNERAMEVGQALARLGLKAGSLPLVERDFLGPVDRDSLLATIEDSDASDVRRASIGVRLAMINDRRPGVGLREDGLPDIAWCEVPGGVVTLEIESQARSWLARLQSRRSEGHFLVAPCFIARYPVTYAQYKAFLTAEDGYRDPRWWEGLLGPFEGDPDRQSNQRDNHPAEGMVWYEAVAYCRWLSERLGYVVRLPTEWEWQQAATGGHPEFVYPWGPEWQGKRANTSEARLNATVAVGLYLEGASPVGALDMAGNVWEWCQNKYERPTDEKEDTRGEARVLRGGSWLDLQVNARCAFRDRLRPYDWVNDLGFRLLSLSPIG